MKVKSDGTSRQPSQVPSLIYRLRLPIGSLSLEFNFRDFFIEKKERKKENRFSSIHIPTQLLTYFSLPRHSQVS